MSKDLPSIEDFANNNNLPSVNEFITEEVDAQLPSVEDYIEKKEKEDRVEEPVAEETESPTDLTEIIRLINDVRKDIPEIPEIKYYDAELEKLCEIVDQVRSEIPEIPEVRYYEEEIGRLEKTIEDVRSEIPKFPKWVNEVNEVPDFSWIGKTFSVIDDDFIKVNDTIETLRERVESNLKEIVEESEVKQFENKVQLETQIKDIDEKYQDVKDKIWKELRESSLKIWEYHKEFKDDDRKLKKQITNEYNSLKSNLEDKIKEFNENSVKTDKVLLSYFENLKEEISNLPEVKYYDEEIKYVREDIKDLYNLVKTIKSEQKDLQESLLREPPEEKESIGVAPDPLTPLDQKFATLEDLSNHYRIFINRIQTQLSTMGGGGAGFIKDLDDVSFDQTTGNGKLLIYNGSQWVGIASESLGGSVGAGGTWQVDSVGIHTTKNVGIGTTARSEYKIYVEGDALFTGNVSVAGTVTYEDVTNVDSIGIVTARNGAIIKAGTATTALIVEGDARVVGILTIGTSSITLDGDNNQVNVGLGVTLHHINGVQVGGNTVHSTGLTINRINVSGVSTFSSETGIGTVHIGLGNTALFVDGNARVVGILTIGRSSVTLDGDSNQINVGSGVTIHHINGVQVGGNTVHSSGLTINQLNVSGVVTASSFEGNLLGIASIATYAITSGVSTNSTLLEDQNSSYYLDYNNFTNTPSLLSEFNNDVGFSTITYVDEKVGLSTVGLASINYVDNLVAISTFSGDYNDLSNKPSIPSIVGLASEGYVDTSIANLIDTAPSTLDTLNELAAALGDDPNFATTITNSLASKANLSGANFTGIVTATSYSLPDGLISSGSQTISTISETSIDSFSASDYRSAKYQIQITTGSEYQITEVFVVHDGTSSYQTEYATVKTGTTLSTFSSDIDTGNVRLLATPSNSDSTTFKIIRTLVKI